MTAKRQRDERTIGQALEPVSATGQSGATRALIAVGAALAPVAVGIAYSRFAVDHAAPLPPAIEADRRTFLSPMAGEISYYADDRGEGRPLLLVHSVNAGASAYEMRPIFDYYSGQRPVYALDLPGFGFSARGDRVYSAELFTVALLDLLREVGVGEHGGADVIALSLGCEFAARAAVHQPELIHSLAFISPTGLSEQANEDGEQPAGITNTSRMARRLFAFPLWSQAFYDALVSRPSLRYFLQRSFDGEVDPGLLDYAWATTHQPGARFAPLYFISGQLFTRNAVATLYDRVPQPTLVIYDQDGFVTFDALPSLLAQHDNWQAKRVAPTRGLPQFERLGDTTRALRTFWSGAPILQS
ncbi:MAG TPA: alpha/beta fold hydrolase [Ktedonobacterales bacterium]|nr:alpha/beta fold hydrolase [Ktedonobacterales bacterium]